MNITGSYTFDAAPQAIWDLLMDDAALTRAIPGVESMTPIDGEAQAWNAVAKIGIPPLVGTYTCVIRRTEIDAPRQYRLTVEGEWHQSPVGGTALLTLTADPDQQQTILAWDARPNLSGNLATIGQHFVEMAAGLLARQFCAGLAAQLPGSSVKKAGES